MPVDTRGGVQTHWMTLGHGPRQALMIHCSLAHAGAWAGVARGLDDMLTMTAFDLPGHGKTEDWDRVTDLQTQSMGMALDFLPEDGQMDLIGHSFGGTVALRLAVEHPDRVRSLTLIEPVFFAVALHDRPDLKAAHHDELGAYYDAMAAGDLVAATRIFTGFWGDGRPWDDLPPAQQQAMIDRIHLVEAGGAQIYGDKAGLLASGALERVGQPTLLIEGSTSPRCIAAINDGLMTRLIRAERAVVLDAGHMAPITHAPEVAALIRGFLETVPEGPIPLP